MSLPDQNITYTKINETQFYKSSTSSTMIDIPALMAEIEFHKAQIDTRIDLLQGAVIQQVSAATDAILLLTDQPLSTKLKK